MKLPSWIRNIPPFGKPLTPPLTKDQISRPFGLKTSNSVGMTFSQEDSISGSSRHSTSSLFSRGTRGDQSPLSTRPPSREESMHDSSTINGPAALDASQRPARNREEGLRPAIKQLSGHPGRSVPGAARSLGEMDNATITVGIRASLLREATTSTNVDRVWKSSRAALSDAVRDRDNRGR